jgi:RNA polymerase sigma-70 factor, ECF subfamily
MLFRDPLADLEPLIQRVYAYVAYRLGDGPDAEDVTADAFERALRYRASYDRRKGEPVGWLLGIARRCVDDHRSGGHDHVEVSEDLAAPDNVEADAPARLDLRAAVLTLEPRDRELIALRYGADLKARQIAELLDQRTNAVEVALHRALERLRRALGEGPSESPERDSEQAPVRISPRSGY